MNHLQFQWRSKWWNIINKISLNNAIKLGQYLVFDYHHTYGKYYNTNYICNTLWYLQLFWPFSSKLVTDFLIYKCECPENKWFIKKKLHLKFKMRMFEGETFGVSSIWITVTGIFQFSVFVMHIAHICAVLTTLWNMPPEVKYAYASRRYFMRTMKNTGVQKVIPSC